MREARALKRIPWRHQGRNLAVGIDCVGVLVAIAAALGLPYEDRLGYTRRSTGWDLIAELDRQMDRKPLKSYLSGDVLTFKEKAYPQHVAVVAELRGVTTIIHAHAYARMVIEEHLAHEWVAPGRMLACHAFRGVT